MIIIITKCNIVLTTNDQAGCQSVSVCSWMSSLPHTHWLTDWLTWSRLISGSWVRRSSLTIALRPGSARTADGSIPNIPNITQGSPPSQLHGNVISCQQYLYYIFGILFVFLSVFHFCSIKSLIISQVGFPSSQNTIIYCWMIWSSCYYIFYLILLSKVKERESWIPYIEQHFWF